MNTKKFIQAVDQLNGYRCFKLNKDHEGFDFVVTATWGNYGMRFKTGGKSAGKTKIIDYSFDGDTPFVYNQGCDDDDELMALIGKYIKADHWKPSKKKWFTNYQDDEPEPDEVDLPF